MNKDKVISEVFVSTDYNKFKFMDGGNRPVSEGHVDKIVNSMLSVGVKNVPIIVDSNFLIYDGQHRYSALKRLGEPITYIVDNTLVLDDCQYLNMCSDNWTVPDFLRAWATRKDFSNATSYKYVVSLMDEFNIGCNTVSVAVKGISNFSADAKKGTLKVSEEDFNRAHLALEYAFDIYNEIPKSSRKECLLQSLLYLYIIPEVDKNRLREIVVEYYHQIRGYDSHEDCIRIINTIYNKNLGSRRRDLVSLFLDLKKRNKGRKVVSV